MKQRPFKYSLVRMLPESEFSDGDIKHRFELLYGKDRLFVEGQIPFFRAKWSSLSEFVKEVKLGFTRFYNKHHHRCGFLFEPVTFPTPASSGPKRLFP